MNICSRNHVCSHNHEEICFESRKCPVCELITEKNLKIRELEVKIEDLEHELIEERNE